jgi:hypothetical protein
MEVTTEGQDERQPPLYILRAGLSSAAASIVAEAAIPEEP